MCFSMSFLFMGAERTGDVQLEGLSLRKDALRGLNLPIDIKGNNGISTII